MKNVTSTTAWLAGTCGVVAIIWACSFSSGLMAQSDDVDKGSPTPFLDGEDSTEQDSEEDVFLEFEDDGDERREDEDDGEFEAVEWNGDFEESDKGEGDFEEAEREEGDNRDEEEWQMEGDFDRDRDSWEEDGDRGEEDLEYEGEYKDEFDQAPGEMAGLLHQVASDGSFSAAYALERLTMSLGPAEALEILERLRSETQDPARLRMIQVAMMAIYGESEQKEQAVDIARRLFLGN